MGSTIAWTNCLDDEHMITRKGLDVCKHGCFKLMFDYLRIFRMSAPGCKFPLRFCFLVAMKFTIIEKRSEFLLILFLTKNFSTGTALGGFRCNQTTSHLQCQACGGMMPSRPDMDVPQHCKSFNLSWNMLLSFSIFSFIIHQSRFICSSFILWLMI